MLSRLEEKCPSVTVSGEVYPVTWEERLIPATAYSAAYTSYKAYFGNGKNYWEVGNQILLKIGLPKELCGYGAPNGIVRIASGLSVEMTIPESLLLKYFQSYISDPSITTAKIETWNAENGAVSLSKSRDALYANPQYYEAMSPETNTVANQTNKSCLCCVIL